MAHNTPEGSAPAVQRGHEIFDLDVSFMRWFSLGIVVLVIFTAVAAFALLGGFRVPHPLTRTAPAVDGSGSAPFTTLQSAPQDELRSYRRAKAAALEGYRWVDRESGVVQIPIERAMELVATQGHTQERSPQEGTPGSNPATPAAPHPDAGPTR